MVLEAGEQPSVLEVFVGGQCFRVTMRPRVTLFWATCPHRTRPLGGGRASNLATDKLYASFYWPAAVERLLLEHDLANIVFEPATNTAGKTVATAFLRRQVD